ncbi:MAG: Holliday junction branch migration protein RuvA [Acidobacteria bacterium]|nr:Holliday junction branch migration protein RuvA [Acidobacteriota bacterium]
MIAHLRGRLADKEPGRLVLDVNGVGYEVHVPLSTYSEVGEPGAEVSLRIHTHVREDTLSLFGFASRLERDLFERLLGVNGVGPRLALAVLSGVEPLDLVQAIRRGEHARLHAVPGVGRKTAERIGLELKDKLPAPTADDAGESAGAGGDLRGDVLSALLNLGYQRPVAERAAEAALRGGAGGAGGFEETLRAALRELAG